jgi:hypothetical protein
MGTHLVGGWLLQIIRGVVVLMVDFVFVSGYNP